MVLPQTLPELLHARAIDPRTGYLSYLDAQGTVYKSITYTELLEAASDHAHRLLAAGLRPATDIVLASFPDHESHVLLFWACCLAGILVCPLPPLHPEPSRQAMLLNHLQELFHGPTLIAPGVVAQGARRLVPGLKVLASEELADVMARKTETEQATETTTTESEAPDAPKTDVIFPERRPSPGDVACFMLTSGSTGNSKAVQLTHANLLSSVRGKIEHHHTTSASRFLNWIAFDHVACLSEVHIHALEANASQWLVAPRDVIGNPGNLLEWVSRYRITYTFSPNFLLAQIVRDVTRRQFSTPPDLSSLQVLISGGEAVPMTTAVALADLIGNLGGPRDALRAGFGMSETGAGCIYDTRPIPNSITPDLPKYLSLGTSCPGVSIRVVDPDTGTICQSGQPGQFQVMGPTVFTQYYRNQRATNDSFTNDGWFITGDSAEIDPDGNLYLIGRDKDCININGVKHPTQDVEHYIEDARIDGVIPGCVYVCPMRLADADTETYAVFYQHQIAIEAGFTAPLNHVHATNRAIGKACSVFCAQGPHIILPLPRAYFFKSSLGKISRSNLAKAYLRGDFSALQHALEVRDRGLSGGDTHPTDLTTPIQRLVAQVSASIFSIEESSLRRSSNIFDMGASSMHLLRLKHLIQTRLSLADIPIIDILRRPEIGELSDYLSEVVQSRDRGESKDVSYQPLVCFSNSGSKPPLFLVHPGVGEVLVFMGLARSLADDRPVYALRARGFDRNNPTFETFDEMVATYVAAIENEYPSGPYYIAGYSFGAAVAFEICKQLEAKRKDVPWFGVLNLPPHIQWRMKELTWVEVLINIALFLSLISSSAMDEVRKDLFEAFPDIAGSDTEPPIPQAPIKWLFERSEKTRLAELDLELDAFIRWVKVAYELNKTGRMFEPRGQVKRPLTTVFCAIPLPSMGTREQFKKDRLSAWKGFSGDRFEMIDVEGEHYTMLAAKHVESFAKHLREALKRADKGPK